MLGCSNILAQNLSLKVIGNNESETKIIDSLSYKSSFENYKTLNEEVVLINKRLQSLGYIENALVDTEKINDSLYQSTFNLKQRFYTIYIYYNKNLISQELIKVISEDFNEDYFVLPIREIEGALGFINSELANKGMPFSEFSLQNIEKVNNDKLKADLLIDKNSVRNIDKVLIKGYELFPKSYLKHFLKIKEGQLFNLDVIKKKTDLLNDLNFANQVKTPEVLFTKDSTSLYLYLEKTKRNSFDGFLGFGTNETTNKLEFDGYLNLILNNSLNYGEQFNLVYKSDENDQKTFKANLSLPYLFGSPFGTELALNIFKKDSTFTTVNQEANIFYEINPKNKLTIGANIVQSNNLLEQQSLNSDISDFNSQFIKAKYSFKQVRRIDLLFPIDFFAEASLGFGNRRSNNESIKQKEIKVKASKNFNLDDKNIIFIKTEGNTLTSNTYLTNELFRFGGINSIRGFEENSILASQYGFANLEYHYQVNSVMNIHTITDIAYLENKLINFKEKLFGFGFGFGILTKAGLLKLIYANGKSENQKFRLSNSKIHISLNVIF